MLEAAIAFDLASDSVLDGYNLRDRLRLRRIAREYRQEAVAEAIRTFAGDAHEVDSDRPVLDFWKWIIESGKIQEFMSFLVTVFLPALFDLILKFISAL